MENPQTLEKKFPAWEELTQEEKNEFKKEMLSKWHKVPREVVQSQLEHLHNFKRLLEVCECNERQIACIHYLGKLPSEQMPEHEISSAANKLRQVRLRALKAGNPVKWIETTLKIIDEFFLE